MSPIKIREAAKYLCRESSWNLTNLELQKILYICHMIYLGNTEGEPLIEGDFQAWGYGPVHTSLYYLLKRYGSRPIPEHAFSSVKDIDENRHKQEFDKLKVMIKRFLKNYSYGSGGKLVAITHRDNGAWAKNYEIRENNKISNKDILEEYKSRHGGKVK